MAFAQRRVLPREPCAKWEVAKQKEKAPDTGESRGLRVPLREPVAVEGTGPPLAINPRGLTRFFLGLTQLRHVSFGPL